MSITLTVPEKKTETIYDRIMAEGDGIDLEDCDWDWCVFVECPESWEKAKDNYDKFTLLLALNLEHKGDDCADVAGFLWDNRDIFEDFFNQHNRAGYRPEDYYEIDPDVDDGFYEAYMLPMESLLAGDYDEEDYGELVDLFREKAEKAQKA